MTNLSKERREERLRAYGGKNVSRRKYNSVLCGTLLYGIFVNVLICIYLGDFAMQIQPIPFFIAYFVCVLTGTIMSAKSANPAVSFLGYNLVVAPCGFTVSIAVQRYGGLTSETVTQAFLITLIIVAAMTLLSIIAPNFCCRLGGILFFSLIGVVLARIVMMLLGRYSIVESWISAVLFSLYIAYDVWRSQKFPPTVDNAIDSALDIYIDIVNLFLSLLEILGSRDSD